MVNRKRNNQGILVNPGRVPTFAETLREQELLSTNPSPSDMLETKDSA